PSPPTHLLYLMFTARSAIYPLSLHDALPIFAAGAPHIAITTAGWESGDGWSGWVMRLRALVGDGWALVAMDDGGEMRVSQSGDRDRKSTRLNSSHVNISYAVFCLKKKRIK